MGVRTIEVDGRGTFVTHNPVTDVTFHLLRGECDKTLETDEDRECSFQAAYRYVAEDGEVTERCRRHVPEGWVKQVEEVGEVSGNVVYLDQECNKTVKRDIPDQFHTDLDGGRKDLPDEMDRIGDCGDRGFVLLKRADELHEVRCLRHAMGYWVDLLRPSDDGEDERKDSI